MKKLEQRIIKLEKDIIFIHRHKIGKTCFQGYHDYAKEEDNLNHSQCVFRKPKEE